MIVDVARRGQTDGGAASVGCGEGPRGTALAQSEHHMDAAGGAGSATVFPGVADRRMRPTRTPINSASAASVDLSEFHRYG
jgi:hypothetical protein